MFLTEGEVRRLLDMQDAVRDMEEALRKRPPSSTGTRIPSKQSRRMPFKMSPEPPIFECKGIMLSLHF